MTRSLPAAELMHSVLASGMSLQTRRWLSHIYLMDIPGYPRPVMLNDTAINIEPDLEAKLDIVQNAINLAHVMGVELPRVALLSAMETMNPKIRSTLEASVLCKRVDRGQITGELLDIDSPMADQADILAAPGLASGTILARQLRSLLGADVVGARVPIILTSRAESVRTWMASCVVAAVLARGQSPMAQSVAGPWSS
jgi:phosphate acetyltransferase